MLVPDYFNFYKEQKLVNLTNKDEIFKFYNIRYSESYKPYYHCAPLYNSVTHSKNFRYCIFDINSDKVFVMWKIILFGGANHIKQIRIIDPPISLNKNVDNENLVLSELKMLPFIKIGFHKSLNNDYVLSRDRDLELYNDYFYKFNIHDYDNSKFRSKHGINKLLNNPDFHVVATTEKPLYDLLEIRHKWVSGMEKNNSKVNSSSDSDFESFVNDASGEILKIIITYKDSPISVQILYLCKELNYADCLYIVHNGRLESSDVELNRALKNLTDIQNYFACKYLFDIGMSYMYIAGCRPEEKRLLKHKRSVSDGCLEYVIDDNILNYDMTNVKMNKEEKVNLWT